MNNNLRNSASSKLEHIDNNIALISEKALEMSRMLASMEAVQDAYKAYYTDTVPELESSMMLQYSMNTVFQQLKRNYDIDYQFHFFVPPAKSFLRSWNNERLDDVSLFRKGVLEVTNTKMPVKGLEIGLNGLMIRGITPVFSNVGGNFLGAIETMIPLEDVMDELEVSNKEEFAFYVQGGQLKASQIDKEVSDIDSENPDDIQEGDFVVTGYSSERFHFDVASGFDISAFLNENQKIQHFAQGSFKYSVSQINNFADKAVGVVFYQRDVSALQEENQQMYRAEFGILLGFLLVALVVMLFVTSVIFRPLQKLLAYMDHLNAGNVFKELPVSIHDQLGTLADKINTFVSSLRRMVNFSDQIVNGKFDVDFKPLGENDTLGNALIRLRDNLRKAREEEESRKEEDIKGNWANEGKTRINEVIRKHTKSLPDLTDHTIKALINYLDANQGGIFVVKNKDDRTVLELEALYAYNYKRYEQATLEMGEGLIGMAAQDRLTVYRTDIPDHFVRIRSGLGEAPPTTLLITPLVFEDQVYGAIEMASFREYEDYQLKFLEEVGDTIASAIANLKISEQTENLLQQSRNQANELASKEEQMRKNLERMQKAEQEAKETEERTLGIVNAFNAVLMRANFELDGTLKYANPLFLKKMQYLELETEGFTILSFLPYEKDDEKYAAFNNKWNKSVQNSTSFVHEEQYKTRSSTLWIHGIFSAVKDTEGNVKEILFIGFDIDKDRRANIYYEREGKAINRATIKTIYQPDGTIVFDNAQLQERLGYQREGKDEKNVFDLMVSDEEEKHFRNIWDRVLGDTVIENLEMVRDKDDKAVWFKGVYTPVKGDYDKIDYIVFIGVEITDIMQYVKDDDAIPGYLK